MVLPILLVELLRELEEAAKELISQFELSDLLRRRNIRVAAQILFKCRNLVQNDLGILGRKFINSYKLL